MKRKFTVIMILATLIILVGGLVATGCAVPAPAPSPTPTPTPAPQQPMTLDIGVASALTGPPAALGTQLKNGALLAIEDQNNEGGVTIGGQKYMLNPIVLDTKGDPKEGKAVAEQLIFDKKVKIIVGPCIEDAIGMQPVTEGNKILSIYLQPIIPGMSAPDKPYTFFTPGPLLQFYNVVVAYTAHFYPEAKTMVSVMPDLVDTPTFVGPAQQMCQLYGITWVRSEFFPISTQDFSPLISRMLAGNPDIIDTGSTGGSAGALCVVLMKQLREAGFKGVIMVPAPPSSKAIAEVIPDQYRTGIVINDMNPRSTDLPASYGALFGRLLQKFPDPPFSITPKIYNVTKGFLQFLNGQNTMDTTAWAQGFAEYRWQNPWGEESFFCGKPIWGINRMCFGSNWVSEYNNGQYETKWEAPVPLELYIPK